MIPLLDVQIINGPANVMAFAPTSQITELAFQRGNLHLRHTKEESWPSVMLETAQQQATFWVFGQIDGQWYAAGMERLRPNQQDKPEGDDPRGFIEGFVEGRNFSAFNGHRFKDGDPIGFMVVQGNTRLAFDAPLKERSLVVEMAYPPSGGFLWVEGQATPVPTPTPVPEPPAPPVPVYGDIQDILAVVNRMEIKLELLATKDDIREAREEFVKAVKQLPAQLAAGGILGGIFGRREAPKPAVRKKAAKK